MLEKFLSVLLNSQAMQTTTDLNITCVHQKLNGISSLDMRVDFPLNLRGGGTENICPGGFQNCYERMTAMLYTHHHHP